MRTLNKKTGSAEAADPARVNKFKPGRASAVCPRLATQVGRTPESAESDPSQNTPTSAVSAARDSNSGRLRQSLCGCAIRPAAEGSVLSCPHDVGQKMRSKSSLQWVLKIRGRANAESWRMGVGLLNEDTWPSHCPARESALPLYLQRAATANDEDQFGWPSLRPSGVLPRACEVPSSGSQAWL